MEHLDSPIVILSIPYDKFDIILLGDKIQVIPVHTIGHLTARTLHIKNDIRACIDGRDIDRATCLNQDLKAEVT